MPAMFYTRIKSVYNIIHKVDNILAIDCHGLAQSY